MNIRRYQPSDLPFVTNSWWRSSQDAKLNFTIIDIREIVVDNPVRVCCDDTDPTLIFGWICHNRDVLYYIYVKQIMRRQGIGTWLLADCFPDSDFVPICTTEKLERLIESYDKDLAEPPKFHARGYLP